MPARVVAMRTSSWTRSAVCRTEARVRTGPPTPPLATGTAVWGVAAGWACAATVGTGAVATPGSRILKIGPAIVMVAIGLVIPQMFSDFRLGQMTGWITLAIAALSLNLLTGFNGQISVGHGALFGVGAYSSGLLMMKADWAMFPAVIGAIVISFVVGVFVGLPALRIKGLYLALVTLSVAVLFPELIKQFSSFTGNVVHGVGLDAGFRRTNLVEADKPLSPGGGRSLDPAATVCSRVWFVCHDTPSRNS